MVVIINVVGIYVNDRCGRCGDILRALQDRNIEYHGHHFSPRKPDIEALKNGIFEPVLVDKKQAPNGIVGHEQILEWIEENCEE